ncbi:MAG: HlyD family efflux transporter periplasmic adaptor subunit [Pseudomonadota bacterium]
MSAEQSRIADTTAQDRVIERGSRKTPIAIVAAVVVAGAIALLLYPSLSRWLQAQDSISRDRIRVATVERGDLIRDISVQGRVVAAVSPTLYASDTGTITFSVNAGDSVVAGALLATIDSPGTTNRLQQEQARLSQLDIEVERQAIQTKQEVLSNQQVVDLAKVALTAAERESRRADLAIEKEAISRIDFEKAKDDLESARFAHSHAVADAALAEERLAFELKTRELQRDQQRLLVADLQRQVDELSLTSPVAGIVGNLLVEQKTNVTADQAIASIVDLSRFEIEVQVPEAYADDLGIGMQAEVRVGTRVTAAKLVSISPEIANNQVTCRLRFDGGSPPGLRQNQRLNTRVLLEQKRDVLRVSRGQFLESGAGRMAYRIVDGLATRTAIETGARSLNAIEIVAGLNAGDEIIVSSTEMLNGVDRVLITD